MSQAADVRGIIADRAAEKTGLRPFLLPELQGRREAEIRLWLSAPRPARHSLPLHGGPGRNDWQMNRAPSEDEASPFLNSTATAASNCRRCSAFKTAWIAPISL